MNLYVNLQVLVDDDADDDADVIDDAVLVEQCLLAMLHFADCPNAIPEMDPILREDFQNQWDQCKVHSTNQRNCCIRMGSVQCQMESQIY